MKQTKKYIITMAALLLSVTTWAQGKFTYIYQLNGSSSTATAAGTISGEISENRTATLPPAQPLRRKKRAAALKRQQLSVYASEIPLC